mgnify:CR=1 FL=1
MTDLTTTHLQRLLWQSTPGPWEYDPGNAPDGRCIIDAELWNTVSYTHLTLPTKA